MHTKEFYKNTKCLVQIDTKKYVKKPTSTEIAQIKRRVQSSEPKELSLVELAVHIRDGVSFSPGVLMGGLKAENWVQQQIFAVDIYTAELNEPILTIENAIQICRSNGILPIFYYPSFSYTDEKPKYRLLFIMDEVIKIEPKRFFIMETLNSLFTQADKSCTNADRIFFGTNKEVKLCVQ